MKKLLIGGILLACLALFLRWNHSGAMTIQTEEGVAPSAMVKIFRSFRQFSGNVYVIHSDKGTILIDPGYYDSEIRKYLMEIGGLDAILLTHGHWDHLVGLDALKADFPEAKVCIFEEDWEFLTDSHLNCSDTQDHRLILRSEATPIAEGEMEIGAYRIQVIHTPGHTRGSVMYYFIDENLLFSGDTILEEVTGPTFRPTGSEQDMRNSVRRFKSLGYAEDTPMYPGHGNGTTYGHVLQHNRAVREN